MIVINWEGIAQLGYEAWAAGQLHSCCPWHRLTQRNKNCWIAAAHKMADGLAAAVGC